MRLKTHGLWVAAALAVGLVPAFSALPQAAASAAVLTVNTTVDLADVSASDRACRDTAGTCSLRAAVMEANVSRGRTTIMVPAGHYELTIPPRSPADSPLTDFNAERGALKLLRPVTITGDNTRQTVIDGIGINRVFANWTAATITDVTITGGFMPPISPLLPLPIGGGGIANIGSLQLQRVAVTGNHADFGAGIFNYPLSFLSIRDSIVSSNSGLEAAGIRFDAGGLVVNTTITGNTAVSRADRPGQESGYGGGIDTRGATPGVVRILNSTIAGNAADKGGGGINVSQGYLPSIPGVPFVQPVLLQNTIVAGNVSAAGKANCSSRGLVVFRSRGHNLAGDDSCPFRRRSDLNDTNPRLGPLADNGGPTDTLALLPGSPAISGASRVGCPPADQRGVPRPPTQCDIGAFQTR
jgi:hypothetical protein